MKSPLLAARVHAIFGAEGEAALRRLLNTAAPQHPALTDGVSRLVAMADALVAQLAAVQRVQAELSGDALADWMLFIYFRFNLRCRGWIEVERKPRLS